MVALESADNHRAQTRRLVERRRPCRNDIDLLLRREPSALPSATDALASFREHGPAAAANRKSGSNSRGWALATSGNFSAVLARKPLRLAITPVRSARGRA